MRLIFSLGQNFANWLQYGSRTELIKSHNAISTSWNDITGGVRLSATLLFESCSTRTTDIPYISFNLKCAISFKIDVWLAASKPINISRAHDPWLQRWHETSLIFTCKWSTTMNFEACMALNASLLPTSSIFIVPIKILDLWCLLWENDIRRLHDYQGDIDKFE